MIKELEKSCYFRMIMMGLSIIAIILMTWLGGGLAQEDIESGSPVNLRYKAMDFYQKGVEAKELSEKEAYYIRALDLWPQYPQAHNNLGDVYERQGRYDEAIKEYEIASTLAPDAPYPYFGLGDVYFKLGRYEQAVVNYEKGLRIEPDDNLSIERLRLSKVLTTKILFPFDSYELTDKAVEQLRVIAEALSSPQLIGLIFEIQGHTDSIGPAEYNLKLSQKRAEAVREFLKNKQGIEEQRLIVKGYGEDRPIASNGTREGRKMNRRVEIRGIISSSVAVH